VHPLGEGAEVEHAGGGQAGVAAGGGRGGAGLVCRVAQQPAKALFAEDLADPGAVQADPLDGEPGADLVHRQALAAQLDHAGSGAVFFRGVLAAGFAWFGEQGKLAGAQVAGQRVQRGGGVAEPGGGLVQGGALVEVGA
jgi:hypothetical protein